MHAPQGDLLLDCIEGGGPIPDKGKKAQAAARNVEHDAGVELRAAKVDNMTTSPNVRVPPQQANGPVKDADEEGWQWHRGRDEPTGWF